MFRGEPLIAAPIRALAEAALSPVVVAKRHSLLPPLGSVAVLHEPDEPTHPLVGIGHALRVLRTPVVVCAADMPFVPPQLFTHLAELGGPAVVTATEAAVQPLVGRYTPALLPAIDRAIATGASLRGFLDDLDDDVRIVGPVELRRFGDPELMMRDIDTHRELLAATPER